MFHVPIYIIIIIIIKKGVRLYIRGSQRRFIKCCPLLGAPPSSWLTQLPTHHVGAQCDEEENLRCQTSCREESRRSHGSVSASDSTHRATDGMWWWWWFLFVSSIHTCTCDIYFYQFDNFIHGFINAFFFLILWMLQNESYTYIYICHLIKYCNFCVQIYRRLFKGPTVQLISGFLCAFPRHR
jgi:hypothetical protein